MITEIVKTTKEHIPAIAELEQICFSLPWSENALKTELEKDVSRYFTAIVDGEIGGYIGAENVLGEVYVNNIAVFPRFRRLGIGESLVNALLDISRRENAQLVALEVRKSNLSAIALYEKCGFALAGERKNYYLCPREDALLMTCCFK